MSHEEPLPFPEGPRLPGGARRVIGPIPPRDEKGRLKLAPLLGKRIKLDGAGNIVRDGKGEPIEETADLRDPREYYAYEHGHRPADGACKGLTLWQVDLPPEPLVLVYARNETDALRVYQREMGITRFGATDPSVKAVHP